MKEIHNFENPIGSVYNFLFKKTNCTYIEVHSHILTISKDIIESQKQNKIKEKEKRTDVYS